ncbi:hypothetical protein QR680_000420 [Steinernema hermaphroditum]|uniref:J domain-containing protein n=1 Tax=Steinernema hermaphroditum TaxID=289476 RepID=A0AA39GWI6_9BILA|nr:hypothetical protein QR680_000420 [Steinernema hermaphroditum]
MCCHYDVLEIERDASDQVIKKAYRKLALIVYRRLFEQLAAEDNEHIDNSADRCYPTFGNSKSDYEEEVAHFYGFWMDFSKRERDKRVMAYRQSFTNMKSKQNHDKSKKQRENVALLTKHILDEDAELLFNASVNGLPDEEEDITPSQPTGGKHSKKQKKKASGIGERVRHRRTRPASANASGVGERVGRRRAHRASASASGVVNKHLVESE